MKRLLILAGAAVLSFAPLHAKTHWKSDRIFVHYRHPAYVQGFNNGYDGLQYCNPFTYYDDKILYEIGFEDGSQAYIEDNIRHRRIRHCF